MIPKSKGGQDWPPFLWTIPTRMGSFLTAGIVREILPDAIVVYGGPHASFTSEDTLKSVPIIDYVLAGEADLSFPRLVDALHCR